MTTFDTPQPIEVRVDLGVGDLRITASDRADTVVEVQPSQSTRGAGSAASEHTVVEYADGVLVIRAPRRWKRYTPWGGRESIDVHVDVPTGSRVRGEAVLAPLRGTGTLGGCQYRTGGGDITVEQVTGPAELRTGTGAVRVGRIGGAATVKNGNGDTWVGEAVGDIHVKAANGDISVDRAHGAVSAKSANGDVNLGEVAVGAVVAHTACGNVDIAVRPGVAAWLDLHTAFGRVVNDLDASGEPGPSERTAEVRARTSFGDVTVRRPQTAAEVVQRP